MALSRDAFDKLGAGEMTHVPVLRFILQFDKVGGMNFGAVGVTEVTAQRLHDAGVFNVFYYKPPPARTDYRKVPRRYRNIVRGEHMPRLAVLFREELRNRNLGAISGFDDGHGRVAFMDGWRTRRGDVKAAALAAWGRLVDELYPA